MSPQRAQVLVAPFSEIILVILKARDIVFALSRLSGKISLALDC